MRCAPFCEHANLCRMLAYLFKTDAEHMRNEEGAICTASFDAHNYRVYKCVKIVSFALVHQKNHSVVYVFYVDKPLMLCALAMFNAEQEGV